ncbi:MAG TPA: undecaprenyl-diphosphatase UppP [Blastocatellia bacterium]|jgi:undecaprenyl-diphosphatase|nr:undecaprenyl-diphosphatase UppP [Blastocatellia bacterium]
MSFLHAIILGLIQGLTEFLPISSTAHLTLGGKLMGEIKNDQQWTAFIAVIQLGTLLAVVLFFWSEILKIIRGFLAANLALIKKRPVTASQRDQAWLGWLIIIGSLPIAVFGLLLKRIIEGPLTKDLRVIAASLIGLAIVLTIAEVVSKQRRDMNNIRLSDALAVGFAQVLALIPGSSRSGTTITGGLFSGLKREAAARFSFLLSIPAVAASGLLELPKALRPVGADPALQAAPDWAAIVVATIVAAISGYLSIAFLLRYLQRHTTFVFVGYRIALGLLLIALLITGRISAQG